MHDALILGGGVIGLSLAYELAGQGRAVRVIDRGQPGRGASWAGAGILPPAALRESDSAYEQLVGMSHELHPRWSAQLREETGIDNGYRRCGGILVARDAASAAALENEAKRLVSESIDIRRLDGACLAELEPALAAGTVQLAYHLPDKAQLRNPRHLKALLAACTARGVDVMPGVAAEDFRVRSGRVEAVETNLGAMAAHQVCLTSGCWSGALTRRLGWSLGVKPIRGQMVLLANHRPVLKQIIGLGKQYIVARPDGRVLAGSTEDDVGFDDRTTAAGVTGLLQLALSLVPALSEARVERTWAGLRPASADGLPYLGRLPDLDNVWVATGHFRGGLQQSPATAVVMRQAICGQPTDVELQALRPDRANDE